MTEDRERDEMQKLLAYANFSKVAGAIGVKRAAVANWAAGRHVTPARLEQVRALYGLPVDSQGTKKEAAPSMTRRLLAGVIALEKKAEISPDELASAEESAEMIEASLEADARLAAELEASRRRSSERAPGPTGGPTGESLGSKRQKR